MSLFNTRLDHTGRHISRAGYKETPLTYHRSYLWRLMLVLCACTSADVMLMLVVRIVRPNNDLRLLSCRVFTIVKRILLQAMSDSVQSLP